MADQHGRLGESADVRFVVVDDLRDTEALLTTMTPRDHEARADYAPARAAPKPDRASGIAGKSGSDAASG